MRNNVYNVTVVATDNGVDGKNKMTAKREVTIMVTNIPELGTVTLSAQQPKVGVPLTASVTDLDNVVASSVTWQWYDDVIVPDTLTTNAIAGATSDTYTPRAIDAIAPAKTLSVRASYTDGAGSDTAMMSAAATVQARADNAPEFGDAESGIRAIREDKTEDGAIATANVGIPFRPRMRTTPLRSS